MQLRLYLDKEKMNQAQFAALVDISEAAVSRWLKGDRRPSSEVLQRIIRATKGKVQWADFANGGQA